VAIQREAVVVGRLVDGIDIDVGVDIDYWCYWLSRLGRSLRLTKSGYPTVYSSARASVDLSAGSSTRASLVHPRHWVRRLQHRSRPGRNRRMHRSNCRMYRWNCRRGCRCRKYHFAEGRRDCEEAWVVRGHRGIKDRDRRKQSKQR
jgi:hypothetical protein